MGPVPRLERRRRRGAGAAPRLPGRVGVALHRPPAGLSHLGRCRRADPGGRRGDLVALRRPARRMAQARPDRRCPAAGRRRARDGHRAVMIKPSIVVAVVGAATTFALTLASAVAWNAGATGAVVAPIVAVVAHGVGCAALAGYVIRLRSRVNRRMIALLDQR